LSEDIDLNELDKLARLFGLIAVRAGEVIMKVREASCRPDYKADGSPVTAADLAADEFIRDCLTRNLPQLAVVTEETCTGAPVMADRFVLVDPLDGTKEFVQGRSEFTVNIALVEHGTPVAGAVYAPALHQLYIGGSNAYRLDTRTTDGGDLSFSKMHPICVRQVPPGGCRAVVSRSHLDPATKEWVERHGISDLAPSGSSLKFCVIAEGEADVYPRLAPTMEWDTAAGHAVLLAAGGTVTDLAGCPMRYGKPGYRNGDFIAWGTPPGSQS
jgi:3'(2'), 5'-bisphosphate nucleotidase